ncbi:unnamed protein product [Caenorhabditis auriculariae]|uniref:Uncharacterized protein n=1 Tax=Caenorhabditis auriculariae TaxID=2777116 RepID=A0A8S1GP39_9PELO|nr:unnamed protein product [Caenorhabditis auriculariae]
MSTRTSRNSWSFGRCETCFKTGKLETILEKRVARIKPGPVVERGGLSHITLPSWAATGEGRWTGGQEPQHGFPQSSEQLRQRDTTKQRWLAHGAFISGACGRQLITFLRRTAMNSTFFGSELMCSWLNGDDVFCSVLSSLQSSEPYNPMDEAYAIKFLLLFLHARQCWRVVALGKPVQNRFFY